MTNPTDEHIALVNQYLPTEAKQSEANGGYGWTDAYIAELLGVNAYTPAQAVRYFWYQRTQETAEYLDLGKPLTQLHSQAREMLLYWDRVVQTNPNGMEPVDPNLSTAGKRPITFGTIERPWA